MKHTIVGRTLNGAPLYVDIPQYECTRCGCLYTGNIRVNTPCTRCDGTIVDTAAHIARFVSRLNPARAILYHLEEEASPT